MKNPSDKRSAKDAADFLSGGGEMGERMRSFDWSGTRLGPIDTWPACLRTALSICLSSRFAMPIWWGPDCVQLYNDAFIPILGSKHQAALGKPGYEVWPEIWDVIGTQLQSVFKTGEATWSTDLLLLLERSGYVEETYFTYSYSPIRDERGVIRGAFTATSETTLKVISERRLGTLRDLGARVAEGKTAEDACLLAAETLAANPADIPFALIYLLDDNKEARLVGTAGLEPGLAASPHRVTLAADEPAAWPFADVVYIQHVCLVENLVERMGSLPGGPWPASPAQALLLPLAASGHDQVAGVLVAGVSPRRALDNDYRSFFDLVAGHIATAVANARAYEEERKRAEALAELDRAKTLFFSNVSHEFRTPLTLMLGPLEDLLVKPDHELPSADREQIAVAHRNSLRLLKLVNTLLDFSRIEAGRVQASYEPTDLSALTADLASVFRSAIERAGMRLVIDCPPLDEVVYVDREMWEKIVLNLLSNAFKFTFEGEIEVRLRAADGMAQLTIRDTGTGIPAEEIPHLFERFHRVQGARGRTYEGTGIGLALVQELVKLHSGTVRVESVYGKGTAFIITIPFGQAHLPADRIQAGRALASTALGAKVYVEEAMRWLPESDAVAATRDDAEKERFDASELLAAMSDDASPRRRQAAAPRPSILLADDNADMRDYVRRLLSTRYEVEAVADGEAALAAALANPPNLVLSDVMMPRLDGFGLLRALRADPRTATIPVILLSARAGEESRVEGIEAGADDYLVKPFSARELLARVRTHLQLARIRREAEQQIVNIWESITDGFIALDKDWRYIYINAEAERMGVRRDELLGKSLWEAFPALIGTDIESAFRRAVADQVTVEFESFYEPWGRWFDNRLFPTPDGGVSAYFRDITERKQAERERERLLSNERAARLEAESANRMKDEFLATLSHELRTPLNAILGWATMLRMGHADESAMPHALEIIERNARSQAQLIDDLLDVSRIITGKLRLEIQPVELGSVIEAAVDVVRPAADAKAIRLELQLDPHAGPVSGDPQRLQQIVWNLLSNAVKFTPAGGQVQVGLAPVGSHVEVIVSDTGQGISEEFLPHVFERFRQADSSYTRKHGGLGLGLAIVRHLIELHGGTVAAHSGGEHQGSTFIVRLPLITASNWGRTKIEAQQTVAAPVAFSLAELHGLENLRLLLVEDEADAREVVRMMLERCGANITVAASAAEGLRLITEQRPDVLISDIEMQGEDGYSLIRKVRTLGDGQSDTAAIALTAHARAEDRLRALASGYDAHVAKPVEMAELTAVIASLVRRRKGV